MKSNNNNKTFNRAKPVTKTLPFIASGKDHYGNDYDADSATSLMVELQTADVFSKLSIPVSMAKSLCLNKPDFKGTMNVARLLSYDAETGNVDLLFFGKNVEFADSIEDMAVVPHVRLAGRNSDKIATITAFEIVPIMEA